jgi:hypothetical protein
MRGWVRKLPNLLVTSVAVCLLLTAVLTRSWWGMSHHDQSVRVGLTDYRECNGDSCMVNDLSAVTHANAFLFAGHALQIAAVPNLLALGLSLVIVAFGTVPLARPRRVAAGLSVVTLGITLAFLALEPRLMRGWVTVGPGVGLAVIACLAGIVGPLLPGARQNA